jgi:hypothetical protein
MTTSRLTMMRTRWRTDLVQVGIEVGGPTAPNPRQFTFAGDHWSVESTGYYFPLSHFATSIQHLSFIDKSFPTAMHYGAMGI